MPTLLKSSPMSFGSLEDPSYLRFEQVSTKRQRTQRSDLEKKVGKGVVLTGPSASSYFEQKEPRQLMKAEMENKVNSSRESAVSLNRYVEESMPEEHPTMRLVKANKSLKDWQPSFNDLTAQPPIKSFN